MKPNLLNVNLTAKTLFSKKLRIVECQGKFEIQLWVEYTTCISSGTSGKWDIVKTTTTAPDAAQWCEDYIKTVNKTEELNIVKEYTF